MSDSGAATAADSAGDSNTLRALRMTPERWAERWWNGPMQLSEPSMKAWVATIVANAIAVEREACAKLTDEKAAKCDEHGTDHTCEWFGCQSLDDLARQIRARGEAAGRSEAEAAS